MASFRACDAHAAVGASLRNNMSELRCKCEGCCGCLAEYYPGSSSCFTQDIQHAVTTPDVSVICCYRHEGCFTGPSMSPCVRLAAFHSWMLCTFHSTAMLQKSPLWMDHNKRQFCSQQTTQQKQHGRTTQQKQHVRKPVFCPGR